MFGSLSADQIEQVIAAATAAPSLHNSQPWRFSVAGEELRISAAPDRALWVADPSARALYMSCGAAVFNARVAIRALGRVPQVCLLPHPAYAFDVLAVIRAVPGAPATAAERALRDSIWRRHTNRGPYSEKEIPAWVRGQLVAAAAAEHASLRQLNRADAAVVLALADEAGRELAADAEHETELRRWIGTDRSDGIPVEALPSQPACTPSPVRHGDFLAARPDRRRTVAAYERFPQLAVLTTETDEPADWLTAGQALEHVLLTATRHGVSASFLYQVIERDDMREDEDAAPRWPWPEHRQMILRLGYGAPAVPAPRRDLDAVM
jgi:nitroreductase